MNNFLANLSSIRFQVSKIIGKYNLNKEKKWIVRIFIRIINLIEKIPVFINGKPKTVHSVKLAYSYKDFLFREYYFMFWKHKNRKNKIYPEKKKIIVPILKKIFPFHRKKVFGSIISMGTYPLRHLWFSKPEYSDFTDDSFRLDYRRCRISLFKELVNRNLEETVSNGLQRNDSKFCFHALRMLMREHSFEFANLQTKWRKLMKRKQYPKLLNPLMHFLNQISSKTGRTVLEKIKTSLRNEKLEGS